MLLGWKGQDNGVLNGERGTITLSQIRSLAGKKNTGYLMRRTPPAEKRVRPKIADTKRGLKRGVDTICLSQGGRAFRQPQGLVSPTGKVEWGKSKEDRKDLCSFKNNKGIVTDNGNKKGRVKDSVLRENRSKTKHKKEHLTWKTLADLNPYGPTNQEKRPNQ